MALSLSTQLESLERERMRLEELLMLDANWRALRELDDRGVAGEGSLCAISAKRKLELEHALKANRIYVARAKLIETIELLSGPNGLAAGQEAGKLASRIVMLSEPTGDTFRAKLRLKPVEPKDVEPASPSRHPAETMTGAAMALAPAETDRPAMPDALMLVAGLGGRAVELLQEAGITRFAQIGSWSSVEAADWQKRLYGVAEGSTGWWIEQAAMLARGHATAFSMRLRRGEFAALVPAPEREPAPAARDAADNVEPETVEAGGPSNENVAGTSPVPEVEALPTEHRLKTAQEIAQALAAHETDDVKSGASMTGAEAGPAVGHEARAPDFGPGKRGRPYARPHARRAAVEPSPESEVAVVARGMSGKRSLLGRLKTVGDAHRFEAATYAAYRGAVEEASVTIVRSGPGGGSGPTSAAAKPAQVDAPPQKSNRFLKALTGRE